MSALLFPANDVTE